MKLISLFVGLRSSFPMIISKIILNKNGYNFLRLKFLKHLFISEEELRNEIPTDSQTRQSEHSRDINEEEKLIGSSNMFLYK